MEGRPRFCGRLGVKHSLTNEDCPENLSWPLEGQISYSVPVRARPTVMHFAFARARRPPLDSVSGPRSSLSQGERGGTDSLSQPHLSAELTQDQERTELNIIYFCVLYHSMAIGSLSCHDSKKDILPVTCNA